MDFGGTLLEGLFFGQGSPKISLAGSILGSIWGSMKVHEGSLNLGEVQQ